MEVIKYLKKPENREKSKGQVIVEAGKIIIVGLTGAGAILLSEVIEKGLITIPVIGEIFKYEIPLDILDYKTYDHSFKGLTSYLGVKHNTFFVSKIELYNKFISY